MATMFPDDITNYCEATRGEIEVFGFLKRCLLPDDQFFAWYNPPVGGSEPDFIVYGNSLGLLVLEVKDWFIQQIRKADPHQVEILDGSKIEPAKNPFRQARQYAHRIMEELSAVKPLCSSDPSHFGNLKFPLGYGVVFPNISRDEFSSSELSGVLEPRFLLFSEDLKFTQQIYGTDIRELVKRLHNIFAIRFDFPKLSSKEIGILKQKLFPTVCITIPPRPSVHRSVFEEQVRRFDILQIFRGHNTDFDFNVT